MRAAPCDSLQRQRRQIICKQTSTTTQRIQIKSNETSTASRVPRRRPPKLAFAHTEAGCLRAERSWVLGPCIACGTANVRGRRAGDAGGSRGDFLRAVGTTDVPETVDAFAKLCGVVPRFAVGAVDLTKRAHEPRTRPLEGQLRARPLPEASVLL